MIPFFILDPFKAIRRICDKRELKFNMEPYSRLKITETCNCTTSKTKLCNKSDCPLFLVPSPRYYKKLNSM